MHEFDTNEPVEDMDEGDLRSTLTEFMEKHEENVSDYRDLESDRDEFSEKVEGLEDEVAEYSETEGTLAEKFAEVVANESDLFEADEVSDRFTLAELIGKADALGAFSLASAPPDGDADNGGDGGEGSTFDEKPDRAPTGTGSSGSGGSFADEAERDLKAVLGL
jgi:hypothetical protein